MDPSSTSNTKKRRAIDGLDGDDDAEADDWVLEGQPPSKLQVIEEVDEEEEQEEQLEDEDADASRDGDEDEQLKLSEDKGQRIATGDAATRPPGVPAAAKDGYPTPQTGSTDGLARWDSPLISDAVSAETIPIVGPDERVSPTLTLARAVQERAFIQTQAGEASGPFARRMSSIESFSPPKASVHPYAHPPYPYPYPYSYPARTAPYYTPAGSPSLPMPTGMPVPVPATTVETGMYVAPQPHTARLYSERPREEPGGTVSPHDVFAGSTPKTTSPRYPSSSHSHLHHHGLQQKQQQHRYHPYYTPPPSATFAHSTRRPSASGNHPSRLHEVSEKARTASTHLGLYSDADGQARVGLGISGLPLPSQLLGQVTPSRVASGDDTQAETDEGSSMPAPPDLNTSLPPLSPTKPGQGMSHVGSTFGAYEHEYGAGRRQSVSARSMQTPHLPGSPRKRWTYHDGSLPGIVSSPGGPTYPCLQAGRRQSAASVPGAGEGAMSPPSSHMLHSLGPEAQQTPLRPPVMSYPSVYGYRHGYSAPQGDAYRSHASRSPGVLLSPLKDPYMVMPSAAPSPTQTMHYPALAYYPGQQPGHYYQPQSAPRQSGHYSPQHHLPVGGPGYRYGYHPQLQPSLQYPTATQRSPPSRSSPQASLQGHPASSVAGAGSGAGLADPQAIDLAYQCFIFYRDKLADPAVLARLENAEKARYTALRDAYESEYRRLSALFSNASTTAARVAGQTHIPGHLDAHGLGPAALLREREKTEIVHTDPAFNLSDPSTAARNPAAAGMTEIDPSKDVDIDVASASSQQRDTQTNENLQNATSQQRVNQTHTQTKSLNTASGQQGVQTPNQTQKQVQTHPNLVQKGKQEQQQPLDLASSPLKLTPQQQMYYDALDAAQKLKFKEVFRVMFRQRQQQRQQQHALDQRQSQRVKQQQQAAEKDGVEQQYPADTPNASKKVDKGKGRERSPDGEGAGNGRLTAASATENAMPSDIFEAVQLRLSAENASVLMPRGPINEIAQDLTKPPAAEGTHHTYETASVSQGQDDSAKDADLKDVHDDSGIGLVPSQASPHSKAQSNQNYTLQRTHSSSMQPISSALTSSTTIRIKFQDVKRLEAAASVQCLPVPGLGDDSPLSSLQPSPEAEQRAHPDYQSDALPSASPTKRGQQASPSKPSSSSTPARGRRGSKSNGSSTPVVAELKTGDTVIDSDWTWDPVKFRKLAVVFEKGQTPFDLTYNWSEKEVKASRRIVKFVPSLNTSTGIITLSAQIIQPGQYTPDLEDSAGLVSCIFRDGVDSPPLGGYNSAEPARIYWITYHDIAKLAEGILDVGRRTCHTADLRAKLRSKIGASGFPKTEVISKLSCHASDREMFEQLALYTNPKARYQDRPVKMTGWLQIPKVLEKVMERFWMVA